PGAAQQPAGADMTRFAVAGFAATGSGKAGIGSVTTRPAVMGIVNVTPDSFSDGGRYLDTVAAIEHGLALIADGADIIDVGGESTRPGAARVSAQVELDRVLSVVAALAAQGISVSVDTMRSDVAAAVVAAGAGLVNDVSGGLADPRMAQVVAQAGCRWVLMHWRGHSEQMQQHARYGDVVTDVCRELEQRIEAALDAGVPRRQLIVDPGLGFAKTAEHNWRLLAQLGRLAELDVPVLLGASRKAFLGTLLASGDGAARPAAQRDAASAAVCVLAAQAGAWAVRVHDVRATVDALEVWHAARRAETPARGATSPATSPSDAASVGSSGVIELRGLRAFGYHGVYAAEREHGQEFVVDARLECDNARAAYTDDLADTVSYAEIADRFAAVITGEKLRLLETLAQRLVGVCLELPAVRSVEITVHKPSAPMPHEFADVAVTLRGDRP
ncbi:MAG: dihydropteroate synthase, partial [Mycobacteriales bacterium]